MTDSRDRPASSNDPEHDEDREAILARRSRFMAAALSTLVLANCGTPQPCLDIAVDAGPDADADADASPLPCLTDSSWEREAGPDADPQPCLSAPLDAGEDAKPMPCLDIAPDAGDEDGR
jgi:hypothetical protein